MNRVGHKFDELDIFETHFYKMNNIPGSVLKSCNSNLLLFGSNFASCKWRNVLQYRVSSREPAITCSIHLSTNYTVEGCSLLSHNFAIKRSREMLPQTIALQTTLGRVRSEISYSNVLLRHIHVRH